MSAFSEEQQAFLDLLQEAREITDEQRVSVDKYASSIGLVVDWVQHNLLGTPASGWVPVYVKPKTITIDKLHIWGYNDPTDKENP